MEADQKINELKNLIGNDIKLFSALLSVHHELPYKSPDFSKIFERLIKETNIDIFQIGLKYLNQEKDVFRVSSVLEEFFSTNIKINCHSFIEFLKEFSIRTKNDLANGTYYPYIKNLSFQSDDFFVEFESAILKKNDSSLFGYLIPAYTGFELRASNKAYDKVALLIGSGNLELKATAIKTFGLLEKIEESQLAFVIKHLRDGLLSNDKNISTNAVFSVCRLITRNESLTNDLDFVFKIGTTEQKFEILSFLWQKSKELSEEEVTWLCKLTNYDLNQVGFSKRLDSILYQILTSKNFTHYKTIMNSWIANHSLDTIQLIDFTKTFQASIYQLSQNNQNNSIIITEWLNSDDERYLYIVSEIIHFISGRGKKDIVLNSVIIESFTQEDILYIIRKALGYIVDFDVSISLITSILNKKNINNDIFQLVTEALVYNLGYNYPKKTIQVITNKINEYTNPAIKKCLKECIKNLEVQIQEIKDLGSAKELMPNLDTEIKLDLDFRKNMSKTMEETQKESPILSMTSRVLLKTGKSWFSFAHGEYRRPTGLSSYSHTVEMPKKDVIDEVGAAIDRYWFRNAKRGAR